MTVRPISILIYAIGGEGGGVLANWITAAATARGLLSQRTSVPGVAQRTGATSYYIEIFPIDKSELGDRRPTFRLSPSPGCVDIVLASELIEACRALTRGFATKDRTTVVTSTHRVYTISERSDPADGIFDAARALDAIECVPRHAVAFDMQRAAHKAGAHINAVLLGALAASKSLPMSPDNFRAAIGAQEKSVEQNLAGFEAGYQLGLSAQNGKQDSIPKFEHRPQKKSDGTTNLLANKVLTESLPAETHAILDEALPRLEDYQNSAYTEHYINCLKPVLELNRRDHKLFHECAGVLALLLIREDIIRVADLKLRPDRLRRIIREANPKPNAVVKITEIFKPGLEELAGLLPPTIAQALLRWSETSEWGKRFAVPIRLSTTTVTGAGLIALLRSLKPLRPYSWSAHFTKQVASEWLQSVMKAGKYDIDLAYEVCACGRLIKGYGDTYGRGLRNFKRIKTDIVDYGIDAGLSPSLIADGVCQARLAATADDSGAQLSVLVHSYQQHTVNHRGPRDAGSERQA